MTMTSFDKNKKLLQSKTVSMYGEKIGLVNNNKLMIVIV